MPEEIKVTFQPSGRSVFVLPGTILLEAAARAGHVLTTPCGGAGQCGKCVVRVTVGACRVEEGACSVLSREQRDDGMRLACCCRVEESLVVEIPESSLYQTDQKILSADAGGPVDVAPTVVDRYFELEAPGREHSVSDVELIRQAVGEDVLLDVQLLRDLPNALREDDYRVTVTQTDHHAIRVQSGDRRGRCFGIAFDIGTTTLVGTLIDLSNGHDLAVASTVNPQTSFGDDVVSRIKHCREEADGLSEMSASVRGAVNELIGELLEKAEVAGEEIGEIVFAGNTTMQQILCGLNPRALGEIPFVPVFRDPLVFRATDLELETVWPAASVYVFPQIGGFVGGDTVAGILATEMDRGDKPCLLVDVGTNGEIVLAHKGDLVATSVAAGPAFEGARIRNGMRASRGAIEKVVLDGDLQINVIGNAPASGICGTGLVDATAALLRSGVLDSTGRILAPDELPDSLPEPLRKRVVENDSQCDFVLAVAAESATGEPVCLYQRDIRELQLANGAIRAGIQILLRREGLEADDLGTVLLAGAFGNFIRRRNARRIGMLPQIDTGRIRFVGNTASFGAKRVLLSAKEKARAGELARRTRHVDLSLDPEFQMEFGAAMLFPEDEHQDH